MFCTLHPLFAEFEVPKIEPPENRIVRYLQTKDSFVFRTWLQEQTRQLFAALDPLAREWRQQRQLTFSIFC